ncbi:uncharacterized protein BJ212DRAFT_1447590 [Suillus subaureus]|uniref:Uncharacterized protein n=1 Tax=Suillus subaureus TaxID=48587 RepID=A0A9P7E8F1_9AGAM|nr:uncharacterized protein BJ212DRAFT_1447590 [Suillus subaureus]KAG1814299.1 hypothetical protein BJ212DRAFT_1447590 [Suillus subaureus]
MHNSSFDIPNQQGAREHSEEPNLETGEGPEVGELGLEAGELGLEAGEFDCEAENTNIPTPVLNPKETYQDYHLELNGQICDEHGQFIHPDAPPPPFTSREHGDWTPFCDCTEFETMEFLYMKNQMSGSDIDKLIDTPPFADHKDLYSTINAIPLGEVAWESFTMKFNGEGSDEMEYVPYREWKGEGGNTKWQWHNVISGDWAWNQADEIAKDPATHGSTFVPILLGSDKTMVSVATRQNDYYPLYASIGNVKNNVHHTHRNAVAVVGFLAIPKTIKQYSEDAQFRKFKKQLFHSSLSRILWSFKTFMTVPEVMHFGDGHFQCVIYGLGPYIMDYPEQVILSCIISNWCAKCFALPADLDGKDAQLHAQIVTNVLCDNVNFSMLWYQWGVDADVVPFTNNYPHTDIHKLLSPNILHQLIKGMFKDHLVVWVEKYLECIHRKTHAKVVMDDIDRRIAAAPSFAGLCQFPQGHGFTQWTGNNSKALMKVYLPAIEAHVPNDIDIIMENMLEEIKEALDWFHCYCKIFQETGVHFDGFSLPHQHSLMHYVMLIHMFGAPNGVCSSITESKHIKAIKEPWQQSSKFNALGQMLLTNQHLDKLAAAHTDFMACGMLGPHPVDDSGEADERSKEDESDEEDDGAVEGAQVQSCTIHALAEELNDEHTSDTIPLSACPRFEGHIKVFGSAVSTFFALSDPSGIGGMRHEHIHSVPSSANQGVPVQTVQTCTRCYDTVFVNTGSEDGIHGMEVVHVLCFFSFHYGCDLETFPCALVHWFKLVSDEPNPGNGMWMVKPSFLDLELNTQELSIIHVDTIVCAAHLLPIFGEEFVPEKATFHETLDTYCGFYVNKFADHHSFEIAS